MYNGYGTVVDVFIPNRKSNSGKRFAFVRFIKVINVDRLVENLPTANTASRPTVNGASSFVLVLKGNPNTINHISTDPALVLDEEYLGDRDLDNFGLGEVKDFSSINNLLILLSNEGFQHVGLVYLGGLWVMIELSSVEIKTRFMKHVGVASWFSQLRMTQSDFVSRERIVWIDIEGVPLHAWSRPTFSNIGSRWGEMLELKDNKEDCFARKHICIRTKQEDNILEKFKIIVRGKIFVVRAKELFVWSPTFKSVKDVEYFSEDDSVNGDEEKNAGMSKKANLKDESDIEGVSETVFGDQVEPLCHEHNQNPLSKEKENSSDPFNLYNLLNKHDKGETNFRLDPSIPFPPGFTPADQEIPGSKNSSSNCHSKGLNSRVVKDSQHIKHQVSPKVSINQREGGSILEIVDDMIKVGQAMGFTMEGIKKDMENIIGLQGAYEGVMVDDEWVDDPCRVKEEFRLHFANRFRASVATRYKLNYTFPNKLSSDQMVILKSPVSRDEVRNAVWGCGENKSPGPDGYLFDFFRKFWDTLGSDFCEAVEWFCDHSSFSKGCNSSFIALILKNQDPKFVNDYRPISLIGCLYKVVTKILANRLLSVISGLISDVQMAFLPNRQILDGPFIINELLSWCKYKKQQAMVFKVDFAKTYDSVRWGFLKEVITVFGFGPKWCSWIRGCLHSGMASVLLNGSPSSEFQVYCGLKQGDPLAPYLFLLVMESLHLSVSRAIEAGFYKGIKIGSSLNLSHRFYANDAVFIGEWSPTNLSGITHILHCFSLLSGLSINIQKSHLLGVGLRSEYVNAAALNLGCLTMKTPFKYLGVMARLSNWKLKTLSVGGRLTLLKSVLGSTHIYNFSIYKAPNYVLHSMESLSRNFFNGVQCDERKIAWIKWTKILASKKNDGLGVSSLYALNRALLFNWVWRFISRDNSLWRRFITIMHGSNLSTSSPFWYSSWLSIIREIHSLKDRGVDLLYHFRIHVGNGLRTSFWKEVWIGDNPLCVLFPRIYALEENKDCSVAEKLYSVSSSIRRPVRGGVENSQLILLQEHIKKTILSNMEDRVFCVKDVRNLLDDHFLPKAPIATRRIKYVSIKLNVFAWKVHLDRLPTRVNLQHRGVLVLDPLYPICCSEDEDIAYIFSV
nr:RNA-directed DNA polymerase, eukaryota [Tanacetum cinerariifolium]